MKKLIAYSTLTGNTKKVAEACFGICDEKWEIKDINEEINLDNYEHVVLGFWVDKGTADKKSLEFIEKIQNKKVSLFGTLGAYPDSDHSRESMENVKKVVSTNNNQVNGTFMCQGAVDPKLINWMKSLPAEHPHSPNPERIKRWEIASQHPNEEDFNNVQNWFKTIINWSK